MSGGDDPGGGTCPPSFGNGVAAEARYQNDGNCCSKLCRADDLFGVICGCHGVGFAGDVSENRCEDNCVDNFCA